MSSIKQIQYANNYPWGQTKGTGASYLVDDASLSAGDTVIGADGGSGTILIGDWVTFAGHTAAYLVSVALSGGSFTINSPLLENVADNAAITVGPTWVTIADWMEEDFEPGVESIIAARYGEGGEEQEAVEVQGVFLATGANIPDADERHWFKFIPFSGTAQVVGSENGCRIRTGKSNLRPLGGGPQYTRIDFSAIGSVAGDAVEDAQN